MNRYASGDPLRELWDSLPNDEFIHLSELPSFGLRFDTVLLKVQNSVASVALVERELSPLPFGAAHAVTCANLTVAYQVTMPTCKRVRVGANYCSFARKLAASNDVQTYFADRKLAIIGNSDALLCVSSLLRWTLR